MPTLAYDKLDFEILFLPLNKIVFPGDTTPLGTVALPVTCLVNCQPAASIAGNQLCAQPHSFVAPR